MGKGPVLPCAPNDKEKVLYLRSDEKSVNELSKEWGLSITTLYRAKSKKTWSHV